MRREESHHEVLCVQGGHSILIVFVLCAAQKIHGSDFMGISISLLLLDVWFACQGSHTFFLK